MSNRLVIVGAPSSADAYAPGQKKAPAALRAAGLLEFLLAGGITVDDLGDISGFRWHADRANSRAMNADAASAVAKATARAQSLTSLESNASDAGLPVPAERQQSPSAPLGVGDCGLEHVRGQIDGNGSSIYLGLLLSIELKTPMASAGARMPNKERRESIPSVDPDSEKRSNEGAPPSAAGSDER